MAIGALLVWAGASALASTQVVPAGLPATVETSFGVLTGGQAYHLCHAARLYVGRVGAMRSSPRGSGAGQTIWSALDVTVERVLHGAVTDPRTVVVRGGHVPGVGTLSPRLEVGRYLIGEADVLGARPASWPDGATVFTGVVPVGEDLILPSEAALKRERRVMCAAILESVRAVAP